MRGNLTRVDLPNGTIIEYLIDGQDRRVGKRRNGVLEKQWLYKDQLRIAAELDGSGNLVSRFVYGSRENVPDYLMRGGATYRVFSDHLGSPRMAVNVANASDAPVQLDYEAFGAVSGTGASWMPQGFAGGLYDADTGLVRFGARDYDPQTGRWTSKDPILFYGGEPNLSLYAHGDPVNLRDPDGRSVIHVAIWAAEAWAAWQAYKARQTYDEATSDAQKRFGPGLHNTPGDAYKHCLASCLVGQRQGNLVSAIGGEINELKGDYLQSQPAAERLMNEINNACGRSFSTGNCQYECARGLSTGLLQTAP